MNAKKPTAPEAPPPPPRIWTTLDLINWTKVYFEKKGLEHPRLEAELLLSDALNCPRIRLYVDFEKPVSAEALAKFREFVKRRGEKREPLQYIVGYTQFIDLKIKVSPAALIPRPETEILAVWVRDRVKEMVAMATPAPIAATEATSRESASTQRTASVETVPPLARVLDLCTGTGCIALYVASKSPSAQVVATDISPEALALAKENAVALKQDANVVFLQGDLFAALNATYHATPFDVIVSNPPYIDENARATLQPEVRDFEPPTALFAAENGGAILRRILRECDTHLKPGGMLGLEFGAGQETIVRELAEGTGFFETVTIEKDGSKIPRFLFARKKA